MHVTCAILILIASDGLKLVHLRAVDGSVLAADRDKYLVDFSQGVRRVKSFAGDPDDFKQVLVDKMDCVKR